MLTNYEVTRCTNFDKYRSGRKGGLTTGNLVGVGAVIFEDVLNHLEGLLQPAGEAFLNVLVLDIVFIRDLSSTTVKRPEGLENFAEFGHFHVGGIGLDNIGDMAGKVQHDLDDEVVEAPKQVKEDFGVGGCSFVILLSSLNETLHIYE